MATSQEMLALINRMRDDLKRLVDYSNSKVENRHIIQNNWETYQKYADMLNRSRESILGIKRPS